jgi:glycosyltransferase involved in cell wall biosynthesis
MIGGKETYVQTLSRELHQRGHKVTVCTIWEKGLPDLEKTNGMSIYGFRSLFQKIPSQAGRREPPCKDWLVTNAMKTIIREEEPDVVHAHDWILYSILPLKKKFAIPLVVTLHDFGFICPNMIPVNRGKESYKLPVAKLVERTLALYYAFRLNKGKLSQVDKFIATNLFQKSRYSKYLGLKDDDIVVIPNPIDTEEFSPSTYRGELVRGYAKKLGADIDSNKIVVASRLLPGKMDAVLSVIGATPSIVKEFPNAQVLLVGQGEGLNYVYKLARIVNQRLNKTAIIVTRGIKVREMPKIIGLADIVVGVGRVSLEGMASGKPVIVAGSIVGTSGGNYGGIVTRDNVAELSAHNFSGRNSSIRIDPKKVAEACIRLLDDRKYRLRLGSFGRNYIKKEHDVKKIAKRVEAIYHDVIESKRIKT